MPLERKRPEDKSRRWTSARDVVVYLDDVDEMLAILRALGPVHAETPDFSGPIAAAEELRVLGPQRVSGVELWADDEQGRRIDVSLAEDSVAVTISSRDDLALVGAARELEAILARAARPWIARVVRHLRDPEDAISLAVLVGVSAWIAAEGLLVDPTSWARDLSTAVRTALTIALVALTAGLGLTLTGRRADSSATLVPAFRSEAPTWWDRNGTAVVLGLVTNVVVGAVFFALGLWFA